MSLNWSKTKKITDSEGYVHTVATLSNGFVGFGVHQKDDYFLATVFVGDTIVRADDVKFGADSPVGGAQGAKQRCEALYTDDIAGWLGVDLAAAALDIARGGTGVV